MSGSGRRDPLLERCIAALMTQMSQFTACNYLHSVGQRLCRWLLVTHDGVESDEARGARPGLRRLIRSALLLTAH